MTSTQEQPDPTKRRIFVVGLPRSGTTLVQSVLNAHPDIIGFPESRIYDALTHSNEWEKYGKYSIQDRPVRNLARWGRARLRTAIGRSGPQALNVAERFFRDAGLDKSIPQLHTAGRSIARLNTIFLNAADAAGSLGWAEKTPAHLFRIPLIQKLVPSARFVHILRRPEDNIASIWDASQKYDEWSWVTQGSDPLARLALFCKRGHAVTQFYLRRSQHLVLRYDQFTASPRKEVNKLAAFCDIAFTDAMLRPNIDGIVQTKETWKSENGCLIVPSTSKFDTVFDKAQRNLLRQHLSWTHNPRYWLNTLK